MVLLHRELDVQESDDELSPEEIEALMEINRKLMEINERLKKMTTSSRLANENFEKRMSNLEKKLGYTWSPQPAPMKPPPTSDPVETVVYPPKPSKEELSVDVVTGADGEICASENQDELNMMMTKELDTSSEVQSKLVTGLEKDERTMAKPVELSSVHLKLASTLQTQHWMVDGVLFLWDWVEKPPHVPPDKVGYEVTSKTNRFNLSSGLLSCKDNGAGVEKSDPNIVYQVVKCSNFSCSQSVCQNAHEKMIFNFPLANPPDGYLIMVQMSNSNNKLHYDVRNGNFVGVQCSMTKLVRCFFSFVGEKSHYRRIPQNCEDIILTTGQFFRRSNYLQIAHKKNGLEPVNSGLLLLIYDFKLETWKLQAKRRSEKDKCELIIYDYLSLIPRLFLTSNAKAMLYCYKRGFDIFNENSQQLQMVSLMLASVLFESETVSECFFSQAQVDSKFLGSIDINEKLFSSHPSLSIDFPYGDLPQKHLWAVYESGQSYLALLFAWPLTHKGSCVCGYCTTHWKLVLSSIQMHELVTWNTENIFKRNCMIKEIKVSAQLFKQVKIWHQYVTNSWMSNGINRQTVATEKNRNIGSFHYKSYMSCIKALLVGNIEVICFSSGSSLHMLKRDVNEASGVTKLSILMSSLFTVAGNEFYGYCEIVGRNREKEVVREWRRMEIKLNILSYNILMWDYMTKMELESTGNFKEHTNSKAVELKYHISFPSITANFIKERQTECKLKVKEQKNYMKGQELRDCYLGYLYAYDIVVGSSRLVQEWEAVNEVISLAGKMHYLQEPTAKDLREGFDEAPKTRHTYALPVALKLQERIVDDIEDSTLFQPRMHNVWPDCVNTLIIDNVQQEGSLLQSLHDRKFLAFNVVLILIKGESATSIHILRSSNYAKKESKFAELDFFNTEAKLISIVKGFDFMEMVMKQSRSSRQLELVVLKFDKVGMRHYSEVFDPRIIIALSLHCSCDIKSTEIWQQQVDAYMNCQVEELETEYIFEENQEVLILFFSLPRPPEAWRYADLEDKVNFKGRGMLHSMETLGTYM